MDVLAEPGGSGCAQVSVAAIPESAAGRVAAALGTSLDTLPMGVVACDAQARLMYGNRLVRTMLGEFSVGLPAEHWQPAYDLRGPDGDPVRDVAEIPLVAGIAAGEVRGARMHQRCCEGLVGLVAHVVAVVDEGGRSCGAVGVFEPVPSRAGSARADAPLQRRSAGRPADPAERLRMMLAATDLLERRRQRAERDPLLLSIDRYLYGRLHEPLDLATVAAAVSLSPAYLTHRVSALTGRPVMGLVRERRMAAARSLLADTDLSVTAVAGRASPWDPAYFARVFRQFHGCSPAQWRRRVRSGPAANGETVAWKTETTS